MRGGTRAAGPRPSTRPPGPRISRNGSAPPPRRRCCWYRPSTRPTFRWPTGPVASGTCSAVPCRRWWSVTSWTPPPRIGCSHRWSRLWAPRGSGEGGGRMISVLVVDDSVVVRRLIVDALGGAENIEVVGTASNGLLAQAKIDQLKPDVITMDIEMPQMDGIAAVRELRKRHKQIPVIMFSTLSAAGASATLEALAAGATDYVTKPSNVGSVNESIAAVREQLVPKIHALGGRRRPAAPPGPPSRPGAPAATRPAAAPPRAGLPPSGPGRPGVPPGPPGGAPARPAKRPAAGGRVDIVAIGSSTGGPDALTKVLTGLPADF